MSKISNLSFVALNVSGDNYLQWALDARILLRSKSLGDTIVEGKNPSVTDQYSAIYIIRHHLSEGLKNQYLTMENPLELWTALQRRYDHQKTVLLPKATFEWKNLRFQDYKSVDEYNSALFRIVSMKKLCGEEVTEKELLDKTFSTFHTSNVLLQQQYRERGFTTYSELISVLLLAEANNELLFKNSEMRPPGTAPLPESTKPASEKRESNLVQHNDHHGSNRGKNHGRGRGTNARRGRGRGSRDSPGFSRGRGRGRSVSFKPKQKSDLCHRCGMGNHWAKNCRTPKHLCELYMESIKNNPEAHMMEDAGYGGDDEDDYVKVDPAIPEMQDKDEDQMDYETSDILK